MSKENKKSLSPLLSFLTYSPIQFSIVVLQQISYLYHLNILWKMQQRVALWISGAFRISPTLEIEAISRLIPIHLHLKKLYRRFLL